MHSSSTSGGLEMERFDINETFNWIDENNQKYPEFTSWLKNYCQKKDVDISKEGNFFAITNTLTFPWPRESSRQMTDVEILIFFNVVVSFLIMKHDTE